MVVEDFVNTYTGAQESETHTSVQTVAPGRTKPQAGTFLAMEGECLRLSSSVSSPYMLPSLDDSDFSLVRRGTERPRHRGVALIEGTLSISVGEEELHQWRSWLEEAWRIVILPSSGLQRRRQFEMEAFEEGSVALKATASLAEAPRAESTLESLPSDASVAAIASRIAELSGLGDPLLAALFKVERETFCRWRTGALTNPRVGNRRRLGVLLRLIEDLSRRGVHIKDWLLNTTTDAGLTTYELLEQGRIDKVAYLAAAIDAPPNDRDPRPASAIEAEQAGELVFDDDNEWELPVIDDDE